MQKAKPRNKPFAAKALTNELIIALFPSKALREYLKKINWQFSERDREILYRYLALNEEPAYEGDYVTIPFPFRSGDLEYAEIKPEETRGQSKDPYKTALVIASELIRGTDSSIENLQMYCKEYAEKNVSKEL